MADGQNITIRFEEIEADPMLEGDFIAFRTFGQQTLGRLEFKVDREGRFGPETVYSFTDARGRPFLITASYDLKSKLVKAERGRLIEITYTEDKDVGKDSPMKLFRVRHAPCPPQWPARQAAQARQPPPQRQPQQTAPPVDPNAVTVEIPF